MVSEAIKLEREKRKSMREERVTRLVTDPQILGLATLLGGLVVAQRLPYSDDPARNDLMKGLATAGVVLAAVSRAGLGGWPALAAAGVGGSTGAGWLDKAIPTNWKEAVAGPLRYFGVGE